jgi:hypothetical protein
MIRTAAATACLVLSACASSQNRASFDEARQGAMMLCVANESEGVGTIRVWVDDFRTHTVSSGGRECKTIRETASGARLRAESMGGGNRGPVQYQGEIRMSGVRCWDWVLRDSFASEIRLVPCEFLEGRR